jgi:hypothetical protein
MKRDAPLAPLRRRVVFTISVILFVLLMWYLGFGLIDLLGGFFPGGNVLGGAYGALAGIIIPVGVMAQVRAPDRKIAGMQQAALGVLALALAGLIATDFYSPTGEECDCGLFYVSVLPMAAFVALLVRLHPARRRFLAGGGRPGRVLAGLAGLAAVPWLLYAVQMAANQRAALPPLDAGRNGYGGWTGASALAIGIVLVSILGSLRTEGWRIPAWSAGAAALVWGLLSTTAPTAPGSGGQIGGTLAMIWGVLLIAAAEWEARRGRT